MAQRGKFAAPSAVASQPGFVFWTVSAKAALTDLGSLLEQHYSPLLLTGPKGAGKASLLRHLGQAWPGETRLVPVSALEAGEPAEIVLAAFGHKAIGGSPAHLALLDYVEDQTFDGRPPLVLVPRADRLSLERRLALAGLAAPASEGGAGLLVVMSGDAIDAAHTVRLPAMTEGETYRFAEELLARAGSPLGLSRDASAVLYEETGGLIGRVPAVLDDALAAAIERSADAVAGHDFSPSAAPVDLESPSPDDIERALYELTEDGDPAKDRSSRSEPRPPLAFPRFGTDAELVGPTRPANDPARPLDPAVAEALEEVAGQLARLQGRIEVLRDRVSLLPAQASQRRAQLLASGEAFLQVLEDQARPDETIQED
jgi:hypothetical protein